MLCFYSVFKLIIFLFFSLKLFARADEVHFDRIELRNASYNPELHNITLIRIAKFNRTAYVLNVNGDIFRDVDEEFFVEVAFFHNRFNNNQYTRSPIRVPKTNLCECVEKYYTVLMTEEMKTKTNFPEVKPNEKWCPFKKVHSN